MTLADIIDTFATWAWNRHHNVLSWYVRPLFLILLAWAAYRRSGWGIAATVIALATSMFWFPAPATTDPRVAEFLAFERDWLTGDWTPGKVAQSLLVPVSLTAYALAFWRRSLGWGLVLLNVMAAGKLLWGVLAGDGTGWAMTVPALAGLAAGDLVLLAVMRRRRTRRPEPRMRAQLTRFRAAHPARRLDVGGVAWSYRVGGSGSRTVLYLPGGFGRAEAAFTSLAALERDHRVVAVDYPAHRSMAALVDGLICILDAEGVQQADVWGTSFGGMAAQALIRRAPGRVSSLVLSNTATPDPRRARRADRQARIAAALPAPVVRGLLRLTVAGLLRSVPRAERGFWRTYLQPSLTTDGKDRLVSLSLMAADFYRLRYRPDDLAAWPGRVLLLSATDDELYRSMHQPLRRLYPQAVEVTIPGGHAATISRDTAYLEAVERFLAGSRSADRA